MMKGNIRSSEVAAFKEKKFAAGNSPPSLEQNNSMRL